MIRIRNAFVVSMCLLACACGQGEDRKPSQAPTQKPMPLDPNPPMSASDIDAIVKEQGSNAASSPADTGNTSGEQRN